MKFNFQSILVLILRFKSTGMLGVSMILDFIWLLKTSHQNGFSKALTIIILIIKVREAGIKAF